MLWRIVTRVIGLGSTLILARVLVPEDFGLVAMASTFAGAVDALSQLGLQDALVRRQSDDKSLYNTAFTLQLGRAVLTALILAGAAPLVAWWFAEPRLVWLLLILAAGSVISGFENIGIIEFRRAMRFDVQFRLQLIPRLFQVAVTISLALAFQNYWALLAGTLVAKLTRLAMTYIVHPYRPSFRLAGWRELAAFSFWTWATSLASLVWDRCDPFILGPVLGANRLGMYLLALEIASLPMSELIAPVADALFAGFSSAQHKGGSSLHHAPTVAALLLAVLAPLVLILSCASGDITAVLLGPKWQEAQPLIAILTWQCVFSPFAWVSSVVMFANGRVRPNFAGNAIVSALKLLILVTTVRLTDQIDIIAAATVACVAMEATVYTTLLKSVSGIRLRDIAGSVLRSVLATAITAAALRALDLGWRPTTAPALEALAHGILIGAITVTTYAAAHLLMWTATGRPEGSETRLITLAADRIQIIRARRLRPSRP
jgi:O-antigen/teichoic acid export membrane protein